jgi:hypothetical protein
MPNDHDTTHKLVQHIEWRTRGKKLTKEQFLQMADDYGCVNHRDREVGWAMFSLGQLELPKPRSPE